MKKIIFGLLLLSGALYAADQPQSLGYSDIQLGKMNAVPIIFGSGGPGAGNVIASSVVPVSSSYMNILASASMTMGALPAISTNVTAGLSGIGGTGGAIQDGSYVTLFTTAASTVKITIRDNSSLTGTLLVLPTNAVPGIAASTEVITSTRPATFQYFDGINRWIQTSPNNGTF